jgi:drug/metabolite transporter (DMT)-like permease
MTRTCLPLARGGTMRAEAAGRHGVRNDVAQPVSDRSAAADGGRAVTVPDQPLAVALALAASVCFAVAVVTQQRAAARLPSQRAFDPAVLLRLIRRPAWLAGLAATIAGFVLQAVALGLGRLVVIEPVLATGLLFALALAARRDRRRLQRAEWAAALAVVAGLAVFLTVGQPAGGQRTAGAAALGLAAVAAAVLVGACTALAGHVPAPRRALLFGIGGGVAAGVTDALVKSVAVIAAGHALSLGADVRSYLLIAIGLLTFTIQQNGYRAAGLAAFLPAFAVMEPVCGALLGLIIYHERLSGRMGQITVELVACAAAMWGIARLAGSEVASGAQPAGPVPPAGQTESA